DTDLDRDLPIVRGAHELLVGRVQDQVHGGPAQARIVHGEPEQRVGVEQQPHWPMYSAQSFRCSSSSVMTVNIPRHRPGTGRGASAPGTVTSLATGRSFAVIVTPSPGVRR